MRRARLEARALGLAFPGGAELFSGLNLVFEGGGLTVLAGRNGSGKTVLAKCLAGLLAPSSGLILFEGRELGSYPGSPATRVAYVYQDARLQILGDSVLDDILFGLSAIGISGAEAEERAVRALEAVGLGERTEVIPFQLSGGEQRRLAIAALLALDPSVLILDEPFANLDWESVSAVLLILKKLRAEGRTLLVLTHELDKVLGMADRLLVLDSGRLVADGEPGLLLERGVEIHGLRDPLRHGASVGELLWLDAPPRN